MYLLFLSMKKNNYCDIPLKEAPSKCNPVFNAPIDPFIGFTFYTNGEIFNAEGEFYGYWFKNSANTITISIPNKSPAHP